MNLPALASIQLTLRPLFHPSILFLFTTLIQITRKCQMGPTDHHNCVGWYQGSWHHHGTLPLFQIHCSFSTAQSKTSISHPFTGEKSWSCSTTEIPTSLCLSNTGIFLPMGDLHSFSFIQFTPMRTPLLFPLQFMSNQVVIHSYFQLHKKLFGTPLSIVGLILPPTDHI